MIDISKLKAELDTDPEGLGYSGQTDEQVSSLMNAETQSRNRVSMSGSEVAANIVSAEWNILTDTDKQTVLALLGIDSLDPFGFAKDVIVKAFGVSSITVAALAAVRVESVSRGVVLGLGKIRVGHVQEARR